MDLGADRDTGLAAERHKVCDEVVVPVGAVVVAVHQGGVGEEEVPVGVDGLVADAKGEAGEERRGQAEVGCAASLELARRQR